LGAHFLSKSLIDLRNAYLALDALLKSRLLSSATRKKLEDALLMIEKEAAKEMREHSRTVDFAA
jgi:hypothetical protein